MKTGTRLIRSMASAVIIVLLGQCEGGGNGTQDDGFEKMEGARADYEIDPVP